MIVAIYARVSTRNQELANQLEQLYEFVEKRGWTLHHTFIDVASGAGVPRPEFVAMQAAAYQKRFDVLLVWSLDRFSREGVSKTMGYMRDLNAWGVGFHSYTEPCLDTLGPFKDVILALLAVVAQQEKARISERTTAGLQRAKASGIKLGRPGMRNRQAWVREVGVLREFQKWKFKRISEHLQIPLSTIYDLHADYLKLPKESPHEDPPASITTIN